MKPWKKEQWVIPPEQNGEFVARMEKVLEVYKRPYDPLYPVVCMDESPRQLIRNTRIPLPLKPGCVERVDYASVAESAIFLWQLSPLLVNAL